MQPSQIHHISNPISKAVTQSKPATRKLAVTTEKCERALVNQYVLSERQQMRMRRCPITPIIRRGKAGSNASAYRDPVHDAIKFKIKLTYRGLRLPVQ